MRAGCLVWSMVGLCLLSPLLSGQGCGMFPVFSETPTERAHRLCGQLYSPDYVDYLVELGRVDRANGFSYNEEMVLINDACFSGCRAAYLYREDQVACQQICYSEE